MCCRAATGHKRTIPRFVFRRESELVNQPVIRGAPHAERAGAARNRLHLLTTARQMLAEQGPARPTMDGLEGLAGLGKGTVFRRFGRN